MGDISNKTLVALLVVAIAISLVGTWVSVSRISSIPVRVTGLQTTSDQGTGITYLEIPMVTEITLCVDLVNFTNGTINSSCDRCWINTTCASSVAGCSPAGGTNNFNDCYGTGAKNTTCCLGFTVPTSGFVIENTGNTIINLSMNSSYGGTWLNSSTKAGYYQFRVYEENNACGTEGYATYGDWTDMPTNNPRICGLLYPVGARELNNSIQVPIQVGIPNDLTGAHTDQVTFTASYTGTP